MTHQQILAEMLEGISERASNQLACSRNFPSQYWLSMPGKESTTTFNKRSPC